MDNQDVLSDCRRRCDLVLEIIETCDIIPSVYSYYTSKRLCNISGVEP